MRDKNLLQVFLVLNVALAACFVVYLFLSSNSQPKVTSASFVTAPLKTNAAARLSDEAVPSHAPSLASNAVAQIETNVPAALEQPAPKPVFTQKKFGWK